MLLEAAMAELRHYAAPPLDDLQHHSDNNSPSPWASPIQPQSQTHHNVVALEGTSHSPDVSSPHSSKDSSPFDHGHSQESSSDEFSNSNAGSSSISTSFCDDSSTNEGVSLLQDDNEFVSRVLNREPSNLGESNRFGSYRSTAAVAAGGVPFQWEAEPGKCKAPTTIKEEEEEQVVHLSLPPPPIRLVASHMRSPSHSSTPSPRSLAGKVKSLINHVKKPSIDHFSFSNMVDIQKSPSRKSSHRARKGRRNSSLSASEHGSLSSTPYNNYTTTINGSHRANVQRNEELYAPRTSLNSSDPSSSPYYFSPLSNASSYMSQGLVSPRISVAQSLSGSNASVNHPHMVAMGSSHTSSPASDSSISSISSSGGNVPPKASVLLANCLLTLAAMADDTSSPSLTETRESDHHQNGNNSLSFASPEMEILDEGLLTSANFMVQTKSKWETTMAEFINRGGPAMNRSLSTSRVTFAEDLYRRPAQKSKYYSAQLNNLAQPKSPMKLASNHNAKLDVLFPLKRPNLSGNLVSKCVSQSDESSDDRQVYADVLDTSLDCSVMTDKEELNSTVQSIMKEQPKKERPAHEVVMHANDENGYAYSPIASAFVFSPRKSSQNGANNFFKPSTRANIPTKDQHCNGIISQQPKSILKKTYSQELNRALSLNVNGGGGKSVMHPPFVPQSKSLSHTGSQKISTVLLRFAEAEEQLYNSKRHHHPHQNQNGMRSPACIQPMCSFLGRALLCRSKLASHAGRLHS